MRYYGKGLGGGVAVGRVALYERHMAKDAATHTAIDCEKELLRFDAALKQVGEIISELKSKTKVEIGVRESEIFGAYLLMLEDPVFCGEVRDNIKNGMRSQDAIRDAVESVCRLFDGKDAYISERTADMRAVAARLIENINGTVGIYEPSGDEPYILLSDDLSPEELMRLDTKRLCGLTTVGGSAFSHTTILARALNIPIVIALGIQPVCEEGTEVLIDGEDGVLIISPTDDEKIEYFDKATAKSSALAVGNTVISGVKEDAAENISPAKIYANVGSLRDVDLAISNRADGIGLFRTELLCLRDGKFPTYDEQFAVYRDAVRRMNGKPVVLRTFDFRGDKGIGISVDDEAVVTQLMAMLNASRYGNVNILFPMVSSAEEMRDYKNLVEKAKHNLSVEDDAFREVAIGSMIETPDAILKADEIAKEADFFSIGTNDLIQYLFGIDRHSYRLDDAFFRHQKEVLSAVESTVKSAHKRGIRVEICGELAAESRLLNTFIEMGVDALSVHPSRISSIKLLH